MNEEEKKKEKKEEKEKPRPEDKAGSGDKAGSEDQPGAEPERHQEKTGDEKSGEEVKAEARAKTEREVYREPRFMDIVFTVSAGALQGLGMGIPGPDGKKPEINFEISRYSIDMLELLKVKTEGKLSSEEARFLEEMLNSLRLKYIEVAKQAKEAK